MPTPQPDAPSELRYEVRLDGGEPFEVSAKNWITALGEAVELAGNGSVAHLACETLPNGTVIARDTRSARQFVIRPLEHPVEPLPESVKNPGRRSVMASSLPPNLIGLDPTDEVEQFAYDPDTSEYPYIEPVFADPRAPNGIDEISARRIPGLVIVLVIVIWGIVLSSLVAFAGT